MRLDVPTPADLDGGTFTTVATFTLAGHETHRVAVTAGEWVWQADQSPSVQVTNLTIPRFTDTGVDVVDADLVSQAGHNVLLHASAESGRGAWTWPIGEYRVTQVSPEGASVTVTAELMTRKVYQHEAATVKGVAKAATIPMVLATLLAEDGVGFVYPEDDGLTRVPTGFSIGTDRGQSMEELLTAWGCALVPEYTSGVRAVRVPAGPVDQQPTLAIVDGEGGTFIGEEMILNQHDVFNHVIVEIKDSEKVATAYQTTGRYAVGTAGWLTKRITGDSVANYPQAQLVARTELHKNMMRRVTVPVEMVPDWRIEPFDPVEVRRSGQTVWGHITGIELPLTHKGSAVVHVGIEA